MKMLLIDLPLKLEVNIQEVHRSMANPVVRPYLRL